LIVLSLTRSPLGLCVNSALRFGCVRIRLLLVPTSVTTAFKQHYSKRFQQRDNPSMASETNSYNGLGAYETWHTDADGVRYIVYRRELTSAPGTIYTQRDGLPTFPVSSASSSTPNTSTPTYIVTACEHIPARFDADDRLLPWALNAMTGLWTRGSTTWGPAKHIMRVFDADTGQYVKQLGYRSHKSWKHFDSRISDLDLNDRKKVRNYNE
jgi:hypothetical protein